MGDFGEFPLGIRAFLKTYRWRRIDPVPWTVPAKPLAECRVAIVSTAGFVSPGQPPFDESIRGGDPSHRIIGDDVAVHSLVDTHRSESFDHQPMRSDPNLAFPIDRLHELEKERFIGASAHRHLSFMGSITKTAPLIEETAPAAARMLAGDGVDVALLVPV